MLAIEYFEVECPEPLGAAYYKQITNDVLLDHNLLRVISKLHIFIDPKVPIFVAVGTLKKITSVVRVRDFTSVNPVGEKITLVISDERYLAPMLKIFWQKFGKDKVEQPDRFTVILYNVEADARDIEDLVVADPSESLFKDLIYAFRLIAPEGFRVRSEKFSKEKFSFVASEDTLAEDLTPLISEKFALIGENP
ncbi:MAG TPA: methanogenesis marker 17 protein [Methanoregula sp.]|nr:methanogenesis marker 17 protein [Methanoregula sp.]